MEKVLCIFIAGLVTVFLTLHVSAQQSPATQNDTLCISSAGSQNRMIINSENLAQLNGCTDSLNVKGQIVQRGQNNSVEISTKKQSSKNKQIPMTKILKPKQVPAVRGLGH